MNGPLRRVTTVSGNDDDVLRVSFSAAISILLLAESAL